MARAPQPGAGGHQRSLHAAGGTSVSNLCLHNIYDRMTRERALQQIVRVLKPGGVAILSDYKLVGDYARQLQRAGIAVEHRWSTLACGFPPLRILIGRRNAG
jgi:SAM-dependent methyltransferase